MSFVKVQTIKGRGVEPITKPKVHKSFPCDDILEDAHGAISVFAPSNSGKSVVVSNLVKWLTEKRPKKHEVIIFSKTLNFESEGTYRELIKELRKKGVKVEAFDNIERQIPRPTDFNPSRVIHESLITPLFERLKKEAIEYQESKERKKPTEAQMAERGPRLTERGTEQCVQVHKKPSEAVKEEFRYKIIVFDDIAGATRGNEPLNEFIKMARHYKARVILSSQSLVDASKTFREQIKTLILFRGLDEDRLRTIYEAMHPAPSFDEWVETYHTLLEPRDDSKAEKYAFLVVYPGMKISRCFSEVYRRTSEAGSTGAKDKSEPKNENKKS